MKKSHMSFAVSGNAVLCNILSQDIKARMISRKNPEKRIKFKEDGIIEVSPKITNFMKKYPGVFKNKKLYVKFFAALNRFILSHFVTKINTF